MSLNLDCIFVFLNTPYGDLNGFSYHTGTARIIWNMRRNGLTAEQYYREKIPPLSELAEDILRKKPKLVGFSCYDVHFPLIATIASHLKRKCRSVRIVIGGPTAMFSDEVILTNYPQLIFASGAKVKKLYLNCSRTFLSTKYLGFHSFRMAYSEEIQIAKT